MALYAGTSANNVSILAPGNTSSRPVNPTNGSLRFNTDSKILEGYSTGWNNTATAIITSGLLFHADFSNILCYSGSGTSISNLISGGVSGTLVNGPTFSSDAGGCIVLDGSNDYISFGTTGLAPASTTVEVWFRASANYGTSNIHVISMDNNDTPENRIIINAMKTQFAVYDDGAYKMSGLGTATAFSTNTWIHAIFTTTNGSQVGYQNAVQVNSGTGSYTGSSNSNLYEFTAGTYNRPSAGYGGYFQGSIAQIRVYNRVLTPAEVSQNFNSQRSKFGV